MKKLVRSFLMLSVASLAILSSCSKEDSNADVTDVKVTITPSVANPLEGDSITITITATGNVDNKLKSISVTRNDGKVLLSKSLSGTSATETVKDLVVSGTYIYTAALTGEKGSPATATTTVVTRTAPKGLDVSNATPLFGQSNGAGTNSNFIQAEDPFADFSTSTFAANKASVDICFFYGETNKATLTSPSDAVMQGLYSGLTWTGANTTSLYKTTLTAAQFDAIATSDSDSLITQLASTVTTWTTSANQLSAGSVLLYKRGADAKLGLIKVVSLTSSDPDLPISSTTAELNIVIAAQE